MLSRVMLALITLFWVVMNVLLWRAEYGGRGFSDGPVPPGVIWRKILTAPDSSSLTVYHKGQKLGFCHWGTSVGEALAKLKEDSVPTEGMVTRTGGYRIQIEGNVVLEDFKNRVRFDCQIRLGTNQTWQEVSLRINARPTVFEIHSVAADQTVNLHVEDESSRYDRLLKFSELRDPVGLIEEAAGPLPLGIMNWAGVARGWQSAAGGPPALLWEAREETLKMGPGQVRVFCLQTRLLDRFPISILVSRVGEILRVDLPEDLVLSNEQIGHP